MTSFQTVEGVTRFETGHPDGSLIVIESGKTLKTDDPGVIDALTRAPHAVQILKEAKS